MYYNKFYLYFYNALRYTRSCDEQTKDTIVENYLPRSIKKACFHVSSRFCDHYAAAESRKFMRSRWMTENKETILFLSPKRRASRRTDVELNSYIAKSSISRTFCLFLCPNMVLNTVNSISNASMLVTLVTMISLTDKIGKLRFNIFPTEKLKIPIVSRNNCNALKNSI